jgi:putative acetyltransferase
LVNDFVTNSLAKGLIFIVENEGKIIAEIHCYRYDPLCFKHTLSNLVLTVDPNFQGQGIGRKIFSHLLEEVSKNHPDILRVELFTRQKNLRGIALYKSLGFEIDGVLKNRILDSDGNMSDDTIMAWFNPNFLI